MTKDSTGKQGQYREICLLRAQEPCCLSQARQCYHPMAVTVSCLQLAWRFGDRYPVLAACGQEVLDMARPEHTAQTTEDPIVWLEELALQTEEHMNHTLPTVN